MPWAKASRVSLDTKGFSAVSGTAPGPARVLFGQDPSDTWNTGSYIGKPQWPLNPPSAQDTPSPVQALIAKVLPSAGGSTAPPVNRLVPSAVAGLSQLAGTAMPSTSSRLGAASKSGKLPSLPIVTPPKTSFKTQGLLAGEMLS
ncbi:hypothetical protein [Pseudomonas zeae]|uniref:hypothetical protein n=1 Tax=Pseudomonas zeae TaxID=2745510 RepID=UPI0039E1C27E